MEKIGSVYMYIYTNSERNTPLGSYSPDFRISAVILC